MYLSACPLICVLIQPLAIRPSTDTPTHVSVYVRHIQSCVCVSEVGAQGGPCTATIFCSIVHLYPLYSASSPEPLTKYSITGYRYNRRSHTMFT